MILRSTANHGLGIAMLKRPTAPGGVSRHSVCFISSIHNGLARPPAARICHRFDPAEAARPAFRIFPPAIRSTPATRTLLRRGSTYCSPCRCEAMRKRRFLRPGHGVVGEGALADWTRYAIWLGDPRHRD